MKENKVYKFLYKHLSPVYRIANFLFNNYLKRTLFTAILSFFSSFSEVIGVLTIVPIFLIISGESIPEEGFASEIYYYFNKFGITDSLSTVLIFFVLALIAKALINLSNSLVIGNTFALICKNFRLKLMNSVFSAEWNYFLSQRAGTLATAIADEPEKSARCFQHFIRFSSATISCLIYFSVSLLISSFVTVSTFIYGLILFLIIIFFHRFYTLATQNLIDGIRDTTSKLTEYLLLFKPIKAMHSGIFLKRAIDKNADKINVSARKQIFIEAFVNCLHEPLVAIFICVFIFVSLNFLFFEITEIVLLTFVFYRLMSHLSNVQGGYLNIIRLDKTMMNLISLIDQAKKYKEEWSGNLNTILKNDIKFNDVTFGYSKRKFLRNLSLTFKNKKMNVLIGASGVGKTTIVDLLIGLYKPNKGNILIGKIPLNKININNWRKQIGYVPQETILLNDSIKNNITLGSKHNKKDFDTAVKASGIGEFIDELPKKLNSIIGERGLMLSAGQRQRISIARALIRKPILIILDEATANLDTKNEEKILNILKKISKNIMIISITHNKKFEQIADHVFLVTKEKIIKKK